MKNPFIEAIKKIKSEQKLKNISLVYPDRTIHNVLSLYVLETTDGKYVFNYFDVTDGGEFLPSYTELSFINGEWCKNPFQKKYEEYDFKPFDEKLSNRIISELPTMMYSRIKISDDSKKEDVSQRSIKEHNLYLVLLSNDGESTIRKHSQGDSYNFSFPFPAFVQLLGTSYHKDIDVVDNVNKGISFEQIDYEKRVIPANVRSEIKSFLTDETDEVFDIRDLPIFEYNTNSGEKYSICFISCPSLDMFVDASDAESISVDKDMALPSKYDNYLERGLQGEVPTYLKIDDDYVVFNGVKHKNKGSFYKN